MKRFLGLAVLLILLTACNRPPPAYESKYVPTSTFATPVERPLPIPSVPSTPVYASFLDNFDRADTQLGLGDGWEMRGPGVGSPILPPATDGFIRDGHFTYAGVSPVVAIRQFRGTVRSVGVQGRFHQNRTGFLPTGLSMAIAVNDQNDSKMVDFWASRSGWSITMRRDTAGFVTIAQSKFPRMLDLDRNYVFEFEATDDTITVRAPGFEVTKHISTVGAVGDRAFWQEHPLRTPANEVFQMDSVWATEDGQPLFPVPLGGG